MTFTTASGSNLTASTGETYVDFLAGCSALNYGHNDPDMVAGVIDYLSNGGVVHGLDMSTEAKLRFLAAFETKILAPRNMEYRVQFPGPTGSNAVEAALKLARKVTGRTNVIAFTNGFHGVTAGALATTGNRHHRMAPHIPLAGVTRMPFDGYQGSDVNTADLLDQVLADASSGVDLPAAIILETVQGEGGLNVASDGWLRQVERAARACGAVVIVDDIQAGCGRTGSFFSFENSGLSPDIVLLSKSISGFGLPMSLVLMKPELDQWAPGEHNGTFRGNNLAFVTGAIAIDKFWSSPAFQADVLRRGDLVTDCLNSLVGYIPGARLKGRGMMSGLDVISGAVAGKITQACFDRGLVIETSGADSEVVKVLAPLTTPDEVLSEGLQILEAAVQLASPVRLAS